MLNDPRVRLVIGLLVLAGALIFLAMPLVRFAQRGSADAGRPAQPDDEAAFVGPGEAPASRGMPAVVLGAIGSSGRIGVRPSRNPFGKNHPPAVGTVAVEPLGQAAGARAAALLAVGTPRPPSDVPASEEAQDPAPVLQGIVSGNRLAACLDGRIVAAGDTLRTWVVERIDPRAVRLRGVAGGTLILEEP